MGERVRELYGLVRSPYNSILVVCGGVVVVAATRNAATTGDVAVDVGVAAMDNVVVVVGAAAAVVVWVQWCWMRACMNPYSHLVSMVVTLMGKESSWWYQKMDLGLH